MSIKIQVQPSCGAYTQHHTNVKIMSKSTNTLLPYRTFSIKCYIVLNLQLQIKLKSELNIFGAVCFVKGEELVIL